MCRVEDDDAASEERLGGSHTAALGQRGSWWWSSAPLRLRASLGNSSDTAAWSRWDPRKTGSKQWIHGKQEGPSSESKGLRPFPLRMDPICHFIFLAVIMGQRRNKTKYKCSEKLLKSKQLVGQCYHIKAIAVGSWTQVDRLAVTVSTTATTLRCFYCILLYDLYKLWKQWNGLNHIYIYIWFIYI